MVKEKVEKDKAGRAEERKKAKEEASKAKAAADQAAKDAKNLDADALTPSLIQQKTLEIVASRGRKGTDNQELLKHLEALVKLSVRFGPRVEIPVLMHVITAQFDLQRTIDDYMETPSWRSCAGYLSRIGTILDNGEGWQVGAMTQDEEMANELMITAAMGKGGSKMKTTGGFGEGAITALSTEEKLINPHTGEVETEDVRAERLRIEKEAKMSPEELKTVRVPGENIHINCHVVYCYISF